MSAPSLKLIAQGSAKDLFEISGHAGVILLEFSDRISVFDYGALPDQILGRAEALSSFSKTIFQWLTDEKIAHGFDAELSHQFPKGLVLRRASHPKFGAGEASLKFIPLEVVFRWGVPDGSSYAKRHSEVKTGEKFSDVRIEYFTKLEAFDRLLSNEEAKSLSGSDEIFSSLQSFAEQTAKALKSKFQLSGLFLWDGKIECAWDEAQKKVILIDSITPDELRLESEKFPGMPLSKELLRLWLAPTAWAADIRRAKATRGKEWKNFVGLPPKLGAWRKNTLQALYAALAEQVKSPSSTQLENFVESLPAPKVFVMGGGGREDATRWRLKLEGCEVLENEQYADAVFVSMDSDLEKGVVNDFEKKSQWVWGARREAAQLEWSKVFGRDFAKAAGIKIPKYAAGKESLSSFPKDARPPVVKLDGLAAGKGVVVPNTWPECEEALSELSKQGKIVLEEQLKGFECSAFFAFQTGYQKTEVTYLGSAKDFKRRFAGDQGPNTGGMGAYSPHPDLKTEDVTLFCDWAEKVAAELEKRSIAYNGVIYLGLLKDERSGWNLIEFNARFGDPETQALVLTWNEKTPVLRSALGLSLKAVKKVDLKKGQALCVSLVRPEYPVKAPDNFILPEWNFKNSPESVLFRAKSLGGRVGYLVGFGKDIFEAGDQVFQAWVEAPWKKVLDWRADILP